MTWTPDWKRNVVLITSSVLACTVLAIWKWTWWNFPCLCTLTLEHKDSKNGLTILRFCNPHAHFCTDFHLPSGESHRFYLCPMSRWSFLEKEPFHKVKKNVIVIIDKRFRNQCFSFQWVFFHLAFHAFYFDSELVQLCCVWHFMVAMLFVVLYSKHPIGRCIFLGSLELGVSV